MSTSDNRNAAGSGLIAPAELQEIAGEKEKRAIREAEAHAMAAEAEQKELQKLFLERHVHPDAERRFSEAVRKAASGGHHKLMILRFNSRWCADAGRAINSFDEDWPSSLTGFAKEVYEAYETRLRPLGYKMEASILDYPDGMPGDVGLFVRW